MMKCPNVLLGVLLVVPTFSPAQRYHTPAEIIKIMTDSKMTYVLDMMEPVEVETVHAPVELAHGLFLKPSDQGGSVLSSFDTEYASSPEYLTTFQNAERAYQNDSLGYARELYLRVLRIVPYHSQVMTFIGQTYEHEQDYKSAIEWYHRAIEANYYDYAAHWFLADNLSVTGNHDEALKEILLARVLNRTNSRLPDAVDRILKSANLSYLDWEFAPRYQLQSLDGHQISLKYDPQHSEWMPYALCKALWAFEPGYKDSMLFGTDEHPIVVQEKECVANVLMALQNSGEEVKDPSLQTAKRALDEKAFSAYLLFEVILPRRPDFVFALTRSQIESLSAYILEFRTKTL
jgi:tetratricopeptide (TPR) repeat protein